MTPESHGQIEPLCKFGPGGDFVARWQPELTEIREWPNPLMRFLARAVEVAVLIFGLGRDTAFGQSDENKPADCLKEKIINAESSEARDTTDPSPASAFEDGGSISGESMLFPNLRRNGIRIESKPKHRLRAHHRAAKKRSALCFAEQGTLFDLDFASARLA